jgi:diguanylate cyclase (GGDEF)-like protein/PAS domain S-box-containing protein
VKRTAWWLIVGSLGLFVLGDIVYDTLVVGFGHDTGYPYADIIYLIAYPCFAAGLYGVSVAQFRRDAAIDGAIVAASVSAVIWHWVVTPVIESSSGAPMERVVTVLYPVMDIVLMIAIVHAVFTLTRWRPSVWLLLCGLAMMLVGDTVYVQLVADGTPNSVAGIDALWPVSYLLLACAAVHPSMRDLWQGADVGPAQYSRARMAMLGAALFAAPAVVIIDNGDSTPAAALAILTGVAAILVAWRIARLVADANRSREVISESEARFRALVQYATDIVSVIAYGGEITYASPAIVDILGCPPDAVVGTNAYDLVHPDDIAAVDKALDELLMNPTQPVTFEMRVRNVDNTYRWIQATCTNQLDEPSVAGHRRQLPRCRRAQAHGRVQHQRDARARDAARGPTAPAHVPRAAPGARGLRRPRPRGHPAGGGGHQHVPHHGGALGARRARARDRPPLPGGDGALRDRPPRRAHRDQRHRHRRAADSARARPQHGLITVWSLRVVSPDDERLIALLDVYLGEDRNPDAAQRSVLERTRDLIALTVDRAAQTHRLGYMALHDNLTGLPNRALVIDRLHHALARLGDRHTTVAVLFIDLDRFKVVNDGLGHDTGDELLVEVGKRLTATVRRQDTVARLGGDEFVVVCEDLADESLAEELAARAAEALSEPFTLTRARCR